MIQAFSDRLSQRGTTRAWRSVVVDLVRSVPHEAVASTISSRRWLGTATVLVVAGMLGMTASGAGSPLLLLGAGVASIPLLGLWSAIRSGRPIERLYRVEPKPWTWWTVLSAALACTYVFAAAAQWIATPKATNVGALGISFVFAALIGVGLRLRSRSSIVGTWMIIVGMIPALMFLWVVLPAVAGGAVVIAGAREISHAGSE
jgi:hypothetical protein